MASEKVDVTKVYVYYIGQWMVYRDAAGGEKQMVRAVVIDEKEGVMHMCAYDRPNQDGHMRPGLTLKIKNALRKKEGLVLTKFSKVMRYVGFNITINEEGFWGTGVGFLVNIW